MFAKRGLDQKEGDLDGAAVMEEDYNNGLGSKTCRSERFAFVGEPESVPKDDLSMR